MTAGKPSVSLKNHKPFFFTTLALVIGTYLADNLIDTITEGEDFWAHAFAPLRVSLLVLLVLLTLYLLRAVLRGAQLQRLHLAAMESSIDGIAIFDSEYRLSYSNRAHTRLYGYQEQQELMGKTWRALCSEDQVQRFYDEVQPALLQHGEWRGETVGTRKDGSRFPQEVSLTRLESGGVIRIARDNSEKMRYRNELESRARELAAKNGELETFSYSLSHDMRSHITRVSSAAQLLAELYAPLLDADGSYLLDGICTASEEMEQLVESMQLLASLSQSRIRLERVNLSEMVRDIAAEVHLNEPQRQVEFVIEPEVFTQCDARLARVALDNLIGNAWKYTSMTSPARIEFGTERRDGRRLLFVRDNGIGFGMAEADKLFEPFLRLPNAKAFPGTGIGLATVQRVVQLHRGELFGIGEEGKGATFYFRLAAVEGTGISEGTVKGER